MLSISKLYCGEYFNRLKKYKIININYKNIFVINYKSNLLLSKIFINN